MSKQFNMYVLIQIRIHFSNSIISEAFANITLKASIVLVLRRKNTFV